MNRLVVKIDDQLYEVELETSSQDGNRLTARVNGERIEIILPDPKKQAEPVEWMIIDGKPHEIALDHDLHWIQGPTGTHTIELRDLGDLRQPPTIRDGRVKAPIPGQINQVLVSPGQSVEAGKAVVILEAMKMFNEILAPKSGTVKEIYVTAGMNVARGELLIEIDS